MAKISDIITAARSVLGETTDRFVQDYDILQAVHGEVLDLEQWLSVYAPQWVKYAATEDITVTSEIFKYALSSNKEILRARAIFGDGHEKDLSAGGESAARYRFERVGEFIFITPTPAEGFTLRIYRRDTFVDALPARYDDNLTNATAPKGVPFFAESYFRNRVIARVAQSLKAMNARFGALADEFAALAVAQKSALIVHAARLDAEPDYQRLTKGRWGT
ncbi:MAG: hypothetical protein ACREJQ_07340 [bacterium]